MDMKCLPEGIDSFVRKCATELLGTAKMMFVEKLQSTTSEETLFTTVSKILKKVKDKFDAAKLFDCLETQYTQVKYITNHI